MKTIRKNNPNPYRLHDVNITDFIVDFKSEASEIPLALADGMNGECRIYNYE